MHSSRRRAVRRLLAAALLVVPLTACGGQGSSSEPTPDAEAPAPSVDETSPAPPVETTPPPPPSADQLAGVISRDVPDVGSGELVVVPGVVSAPGQGEPWQMKVSVEGGLQVDGAAFAAMVMATLNDPRGWSNDGYTFARTDGDADVEVVLASPDTSEAMCQPLQTFGKLSCRTGDQAILTLFRWVNGTEDYADDLTGYRQYVVNHEVGHALGHGHVDCPGPGEPAPLMMQQTMGLDGCATNAWPYP